VCVRHIRINIPPFGNPEEEFTELPSLVILVVPDGVKQLVAYRNLGGRGGESSSNTYWYQLKATNTCDRCMTRMAWEREDMWLKYRVYSGDIRGPPSFSATSRRGGGVLQVAPAAHTAGGGRGSPPLGAH